MEKERSCQKFFPDHYILLDLISVWHVGREIACLTVSRSVGLPPTVTLPRLRKLTPPDRISGSLSTLPHHTENISLNFPLPYICRLGIRNDVFSSMSLSKLSVLVAKDIKANSTSLSQGRFYKKEISWLIKLECSGPVPD